VAVPRQPVHRSTASPAVGSPPRIGESLSEEGGVLVRLYRDVWLTVTAALLVCGVWVAVVELSVATVSSLLLFTWAVGGCAVALVHYDDTPRCSWGRFLAETVLIGLGFLAFCGVLVLLGPAALLPIALIVAGSPFALRTAARVFRRWHGVAGPQGAADESPPAAVLAAITEPSPVVFPPLSATAMDLEELCWAWRRSFVRLQCCRTVAETSRVVAERQLCMDELERRNPVGLSAWLEAGARAASDPSRFVMPADRNDCSDSADEAA
jgi:hypothetical protein